MGDHGRVEQQPQYQPQHQHQPRHATPARLLPEVVLSVAASVDGRIDDRTPQRLLLSNAADLAEVDALRADADAILVGAGTLRADNPRLLVNSPALRAGREARGLPPYPVKVALTGSGDLDPALNFWHTGGDKLAYAPDAAAPPLRHRLGGLAETVATGPELDPVAVLADLAGRGVRRLLVEGGQSVHTLFLTAGLVDRVRFAVAPFFVGDPAAPGFVGAGAFPQDARHRMALLTARAVGDMAVLEYAVPPTGKLTAADERWLREAIALSRLCPPSETAFSVGAVVVGADGTELARGYSRETDPHDHAEEAALAKLAPDDPRLRTATLYSTLEPCGARASRPRPCAQLVREAGIPRVVIAWREPDLFVPGADGTEQLAAAGTTVLELPALAAEARAVNAHLTL